MADSRLRHAVRQALRLAACRRRNPASWRRRRERKRIALPGHRAAIVTMVLLMMLSLAVLVAALTLW